MFILVMQLLGTYTSVECERATSDNVALLSKLFHSHLPVSHDDVTMLARRRVECEERSEGIGTGIILHYCQVLSSKDLQMGNAVYKSFPV